MNDRSFNEEGDRVNVNQVICICHFSMKSFFRAVTIVNCVFALSVIYLLNTSNHLVFRNAWLSNCTYLFEPFSIIPMLILMSYYVQYIYVCFSFNI